MRRSGAGDAESAARRKRAHHHLRARFGVGWDPVGLLQTSPEKPDCQESEVIAERILSDEHMLLRQARIRAAAARR